MLCFDLTPHHNAYSDSTRILENGNIGVHAKFGEKLTETINCLIYLEYDSKFTINHMREVSISY